MAKRKNSDAVGGLDILKSELRDGSFHRMYVFFGEESYLLEYYRARLRKKLVDGPAEDFNYHRFTEENWDLGAFLEAVDAIPMMSEYSLIEIIDVDPFSRGEAERRELAEAFSALPEYCTLVYIYDTEEWKPDKRMKALWGAMEKSCLQVEFPKQNENQLISWIQRHLAQGGKTMSDALCRRLILLTGGSMTTLAAELQKLISYSDQTELTRDDVDTVVIPVMEAAIFDITRDVGRGNFDAALQKLRDLLRQDTEPISINAVIGRQMRQLYGAKVLMEHGRGPEDLSRMLGTWDSAARELYSQARRLPKAVIRRGIQLSAQTDLAMKTSGGDNAVLVETLLLQLARDLGGARP